MAQLSVKKLIEKLNECYARSEALKLLKKEWRALNLQSGIPATGFCYISSEVLFHALGGRTQGYIIKRQAIATGTHWWIEKNGKILDPTSSQLSHDFIRNGISTNFLTQQPSKRAVQLAEIAGIVLTE